MSEDQYQALVKKADSAGVRLTSPRLAILKAIAHSKDHPDAEQILQRARYHHKALSAASVYRTLRALEEAGVLLRHEWSGRGRFEEASGDRHFHLIDLLGGDVLELPANDIEPILERIAAHVGYELVDYRLELFGHQLGSGLITST